MDNGISNLKELIKKIEEKKILLPDFQRGFVWKDEEQQKKIVASVLAKMPIGSILLLKSEADDYSSKQIGSRKTLETSDIKEKVEFLLDGQQRMTVLTNVFSNVIHEQCDKVSELVSPTLKRRFFLRIPKWKDCKEEETDIFGVRKLKFKYENPDSEYPDFLSGDILKYVECLGFLNNDKKPYNPQNGFTTELDDFCLTYEDGYLIPLYLLIPSRGGNGSKMQHRLQTIKDGIANKIKQEILTAYVECQTELEKMQFIDSIVFDESEKKKAKAGKEQFEEYLSLMEFGWKTDLNEYLDSCIKRVALNKIIVESEQRERAIDIYENLNRGGVSLSTFDLIMARVAKVNRNWYTEFIGSIKEKQEYNTDVVPKEIRNVVKEEIEKKNYNSIIQTKCFNEEKNELSGIFIDAFLDVLSLYCNNNRYDIEEYHIENIKRNQILSLEPEEINQNTKIVCTALSRALFFFQTRCGIRSVNEINYSLMLVLVGVIFTNDEWFQDSKVHDLLEAWYWTVVFSGEFDKDQNVNMITHLQKMVKTISKAGDIDWLAARENDVLNGQNFSDENFLLMEKAKEDRYPKQILRSFFCQYLLAKTYTDMFDDSKKISVFAEDADALEAHHIIPLGSAKKVGESAAELRNKPGHICNSPLNFVYITKGANKEISSKELDSYIKDITVKAKSALHISNLSYEDDKVKDLLRERYTDLKGDITSHIANLRSDYS